MPIALIILLIILTAIALRKITNVIIPIWAIMAVGALAVLLFRQITPAQALHAIEPDVIFLINLIVVHLFIYVITRTTRL